MSETDDAENLLARNSTANKPGPSERDGFPLLGGQVNYVRDKARHCARLNYDVAAISVLIGFHLWHAVNRSAKNQKLFMKHLGVEEQALFSHFFSYAGNLIALHSTNKEDLEDMCGGLADAIEAFNKDHDGRIFAELSGDRFDLKNTVINISQACHTMLGEEDGTLEQAQEDGNIDPREALDPGEYTIVPMGAFPLEGKKSASSQSDAVTGEAAPEANPEIRQRERLVSSRRVAGPRQTEGLNYAADLDPAMYFCLALEVFEEAKARCARAGIRLNVHKTPQAWKDLGPLKARSWSDMMLYEQFCWLAIQAERLEQHVRTRFARNNDPDNKVKDLKITHFETSNEPFITNALEAVYRVCDMFYDPVKHLQISGASMPTREELAAGRAAAAKGDDGKCQIFDQHYFHARWAKAEAKRRKARASGASTQGTDLPIQPDDPRPA